MLFFLAHLTARYVLSSLNISSGGTKFEIFREHVGYLHFVLFLRARLFDLLLQVMLLVITGVKIDTRDRFDVCLLSRLMSGQILKDILVRAKLSKRL